MSEGLLSLAHKNVRIAAPAGVLTVLLAAGCSGSKNSSATPESSPTGSVSSAQTMREVVPDFSRLTRGGVSCEGNTPRPCYQPLYKRPEITRPLTVGDIVNPVGEQDGQTGILWPRESYKDEMGDGIDVVCQVRVPGHTTQDAYGVSSDAWDVVRVPSSRVNPAALQEAQNGTAKFGVETSASGKVTAVYAYAAGLWLRKGAVFPDLPPCTAQQNPDGYAPAQ